MKSFPRLALPHLVTLFQTKKYVTGLVDHEILIRRTCSLFCNDSAPHTKVMFVAYQAVLHIATGSSCGSFLILSARDEFLSDVVLASETAPAEKNQSIAILYTPMFSEVTLPNCLSGTVVVFSITKDAKTFIVTWHEILNQQWSKITCVGSEAFLIFKPLGGAEVLYIIGIHVF